LRHPAFFTLRLSQQSGRYIEEWSGDGNPILPLDPDDNVHAGEGEPLPDLSAPVVQNVEALEKSHVFQKQNTNKPLQ